MVKNKSKKEKTRISTIQKYFIYLIPKRPRIFHLVRDFNLGFMQIQKEERNSPDSGAFSPKKKIKKRGSFVLGESAVKLSLNELSFSPFSNLKTPLKTLKKEKEVKKNQDFEFSGVGGFFIASDIVYSQNEHQVVYYLADNETVQSEPVVFDNFVRMESCKLLVTDNLKNVGSSLLIEAIDKITRTFRKRTTTIKVKEKKDLREKQKDVQEEDDLNDEDYFNQKTNCKSS